MSDQWATIHCDPSSDLDDIEDPITFPLISVWLMELDAGPWGADGQHFAQYGPVITGKGYYRLCELADTMTVVDMQAACPGILDGVAKSLLRNAIGDVKHMHEKVVKEWRQQ